MNYLLLLSCVSCLALSPMACAFSSDGWVGTTTSWALRQSSPTAILAIRCMVPAEVGSNSLQVHLDGNKIASHAVDPGEHDLRFAIVGAIAERSVTLDWDRTSSLPAPDGRQVSARILRIAIDPIQGSASEWTPDTDIIARGGPVGLGFGWQPLETWQGNAFRWLSGSCQIAIVVDGAGAGILTLDAQPGTGTKMKPAEVHLLDRDGNLVDRVEINSRMRGDLLVPSKAIESQPLFLTVINGGATTKDDPRSLDLQVFSCTWAASSMRGGKK